MPLDIHFQIEYRGRDQITEELWFAGDPRLTEAQIARYASGGRSGRIQPIETMADGTLSVRRDFVITPEP